MTGTRWAATEIGKVVCRIFGGSEAIFSASSRMNGITLSRASTDATPGWPAPERAWSVPTATAAIPNCRWAGAGGPLSGRGVP